jgi:hypothetical protein
MSETAVMTATWGVSRDPVSQFSYDSLPEHHKADADAIAANLAHLIDQFPSRVSSRERICFYRQPDPLIEVAYVVDRANHAYIVKHFKAPLPPLTTGFVSYSHKDESFFKEFSDHVQALHANGYLTLWSDKEIKKGSEWEKEIKEAIERAGLAVLLVTPRFIASEFIVYDELPLILMRKRDGRMEVFWIPVADCDVAAIGLEKLQALCDTRKPLMAMRKSRRDSALKEIAKCLRLKIHGGRGAV